MHAGRWFIPRVNRRIALCLTVAVAIQTASCGTLIHPERCGRPHSGALDPSVVVLDGLGVLVFLVPGVVAFIVDFSTGAVWLPAGSYTVVYNAAAKSGASLAGIAYSLCKWERSGPVDPFPIDPMDPAPPPPPPGGQVTTTDPVPIQPIDPIGPITNPYENA